MPTPTTPTTTPVPLIWFTDRSRVKTGLSRCQVARYLGYHFGPTGYGITARRESLPLATGIAVHLALSLLVAILQQFDRLPSLGEVRDIIKTIVGDYLTRCEERGYRGVLSGEHTDETIREQATLLSGLIWAFRLDVLPWIHENYRIVSIEKERLHMLQCSCGAPPLDGDEHIRRGCTGIALMIRTDVLGEHRVSRNLAYFEAKTTGWDSPIWAEQFETDPQLCMGTVDAEKLWGAEVTEIFVLALSKGRRVRDRYEPEDSMKRQQSPLCYGYCRPGNPPLTPDDWLPTYEWVNERGETKRASRAHRRKGVWQLAESDWPVWRAYANNDAELTPEEFWVRFLPDAVRKKTCYVLGPLNRQDEQLKSFLRGVRGEEERWQQALWALYELQAAWGSEAFEAELDRLLPRSWNCRPFGREHQCEFVPLCHRHIGWEDPIGSGHYQPRLPHHAPELAQAVARGLMVAEAETVEEDE